MGNAEQIASYLSERFAGHEIVEEWDRSRNVLVLKLARGRRTMLAELTPELLEKAKEEDLSPRLDEWDLPGSLRKHFRVLVTPEGLEPLPWKQLPSVLSSAEEASWESFPASDPPPNSSISGKRPK